MSRVELGPGAEFDLIRSMRERWGDLARDIGDDAAIITPPRGERVLVSTDTAVQGVHFRREWLSLREISARAVTAALSDLAAMAAEPAGVLVALQLTSDALRDDGLAEIADGIGDAVRAARTLVLGGNLSKGDSLAITTTVLGFAFAPLRREDARPGDLLYVTGELGAPRAALRALEGGRVPSPALRARLATPAARLREARWLSVSGAVAAIDISDGLAGDAGHLAAASGAAIEIQADRLPVHDGATLEDALSGGEEYELLVATRAPLAEADFAERFNIPITSVGRVVEGAPEVRLFAKGRRIAAPMGHDHFSP